MDVVMSEKLVRAMVTIDGAVTPSERFDADRMFIDEGMASGIGSEPKFFRGSKTTAHI